MRKSRIVKKWQSEFEPNKIEQITQNHLFEHKQAEGKRRRAYHPAKPMNPFKKINKFISPKRYNKLCSSIDIIPPPPEAPQKMQKEPISQKSKSELKLKIFENPNSRKMIQIPQFSPNHPINLDRSRLDGINHKIPIFPTSKANLEILSRSSATITSLSPEYRKRSKRKNHVLANSYGFFQSHRGYEEMNGLSFVEKNRRGKIGLRSINRLNFFQKGKK
jgi:hypothetical protein